MRISSHELTSTPKVTYGGLAPAGELEARFALPGKGPPLGKFDAFIDNTNGIFKIDRGGNLGGPEV